MSARNSPDLDLSDNELVEVEFNACVVYALLAMAINCAHCYVGTIDTM